MVGGSIIESFQEVVGWWGEVLICSCLYIPYDQYH
jgi:hypothetical protein